MERLYEAQRIGQIGDWAFDVVDGTISWSPQVYEITGRDPAAGPPQSYDEMASIFEPDSKGRLRRHVDRAVETGQPQSYDLVLERPDGRRVHVTARSVAHRDEQGQVVALTGTVQDITARHRADRLLLESELRLGFALEAADIGDWDMDLRTNVARRSLRHDQCFGYLEPVAEWGYDTFLAHVDAVDRARVNDRFLLAMSGGGDYDVEFRVTWSDGSVHWLWSKGRFFFDDAEQPYRVVGIVVDITDRRREVEAALRLAAIIESSEDAIISQDRSGVVTSWNPGAERLFGYPAATMLGRRLDHLAGPSTGDDDRHGFDRAARGEAVVPFEGQRRRGDGTCLDVMLTLSPLRDVDGQVVGVSTIARDIGDRVRLEQSLRHQALHEDRIAERERALLAEAVHDHPLQLVVAAILRLDGVQTQLPESAQPAVEQITGLLEQAVEGLRHVILSASPPDLSSGLGTALRVLAEDIFTGTTTRVEVTGPSHVPLLVETTAQAYRILREALINVRKHAAASTVRITLVESPGRMAVAVADDGIAGATGDSDPGHLGMKTMRARATAVGGTLSVTSAPGQGTTVELELPRHRTS